MRRKGYFPSFAKCELPHTSRPIPDLFYRAGVAVNAGETFGGADRHALCEGGDDLNLLVSGKGVHGGRNPSS